MITWFNQPGFHKFMKSCANVALIWRSEFPDPSNPRSGDKETLYLFLIVGVFLAIVPW